MEMNTLVADIKAKLEKWGYGGRPLEESIALYQANHSPAMQDLCATYHGRSMLVDGDVGPATAQLMNTRFCDCLDIMPGAAIQEANWPTACRGDITVSWNWDSIPGLTPEEVSRVWPGVKDEYEKYFELAIVLNKSDYPRTRIYAAMKALPGSTLAWSYLATGSCASRLEQAYDSTIRWSWNLAIGTWRHEVGHALGMNHTPGDEESIMFPSMRGQTVLNSTDIAQMVRLGYKRRTTPVDPDWGMF